MTLPILVTFCPRRDTAANFTSTNPVLQNGELARETDTGKVKFGDGTTAWNSLPYTAFGGVSSFNGRSGTVTLSYSDVTGALGFTPTSVSGAVAGVAAAAGSGLVKSSGSALSAAVAGTDYVAPGAAAGSGLTISTSRLLGRTSSGTGALQEISVSGGLSLSGGSLTGVLLAHSAVAATVPATTTETTLASITVPANTMGANGRIEIETLWSYTNSANNKILRVKFGSVTLQTIFSTTTASLQVKTFVANRNNTASQVAAPNSSTGAGATTNTVVTGTVDTTSDVTIAITGQLANTGETLTLEAYSVRLYK